MRGRNKEEMKQRLSYMCKIHKNKQHKLNKVVQNKQKSA